MSATCYKRPHVDTFICIQMATERNQGTKKNPPGTYIQSTAEIKAPY